MSTKKSVVIAAVVSLSSSLLTGLLPAQAVAKGNNPHYLTRTGSRAVAPQVKPAGVSSEGMIAATSAHVQPRSSNPLDPSYFSDRAAVPELTIQSMNSVKSASQTGNPLHPTYFATRLEGSKWLPTAMVMGESYRDLGNPLYPGYKR